MAHIQIQEILNRWDDDLTPAQENRLQVLATMALAEQLSVANAIAALTAPGSLLVEETLTSAKTDTAVLRVNRRNELRRTVREGLGL